MPVDAKELKREADARAERMRSAAWATEDHDGWGLPQAGDQPDPGGAPEGDVLASLDALSQQVAVLAEVVQQIKGGGINDSGQKLPDWLLEAAGDPRTYDGPDKARITVCTRVRPELAERLQQLQARLKLRSAAGTLELVLRIGLEGTDRLPAKPGGREA